MSKGNCGQATCKSLIIMAKKVRPIVSLLMMDPKMRGHLNEMTLEKWVAIKKLRLTLILCAMNHRKYNSVLDRMFGMSFHCLACLFTLKRNMPKTYRCISCLVPLGKGLWIFWGHKCLAGYHKSQHR